MAAKLKNLELEVDLIISEDEGDAAEKKTAATRRSSRTAAAATDKTPGKGHQQKKPDHGDKSPHLVGQVVGLQTPRRSTRKSIRPAQDYDDIVTKSAGKSAAGQRDEHTDDEHGEPATATRWTPAKVGRVSEKRRGRSRKLTKKGKQQQAAPNDSDAENALSEGNAKQTEEPASEKEKSNEEQKSIEEEKRIEEIKSIEEKKSIDEEKSKGQGEPLTTKNAGKRSKRTRGKKTDEGKVVEEIKEAEAVVMDAAQTKEVLVEQENEVPVEQENEAPVEVPEAKKDTTIAKVNEDVDDAKEEATTTDKLEDDAMQGGQEGVGEKVEEPLQVEKEAADVAGADAGEGTVTTKEEPEASDVDLKEGPVPNEDEKAETKEANPPANGSPDAGKGSAPSKALFDGNSSGHFGSYLQAHRDDLEDLGLNPLASSGDAPEEKPPTYEEMPTLRIDDVPASPNGTGDTFDVSDCIVVGDDDTPVAPVADAERMSPLSDVEMQPLQISDDEADEEQPPAMTIPTIVVEHVDEAPPPVVGPVAALRTSLRRQPTPHKKRDTVSAELKALARAEANSPAVTIELPVTTLQPKQIVLQGIRKRSLSMTVGGDGGATKGGKGVRFHSPANQTMMCDEIDLKLARSAKKVKTSADEFVTQRRRRSKSVDEGASMRLKRLGTPSKGRAGEPSANDKKISRCKIPNFRAIHEKHFEQMENLLEHMRRKTERAQLLSNSATKQRPQRDGADDGAPKTQSKARLAIIPAAAGTVEKPQAPALPGRKALREPNPAAAAKGQKAPTAKGAAKKPPFNLSTQLEADKSRAPLSVTICGTTTTTPAASATKQLNSTVVAEGGRPPTRIPVATAANNSTLAYDDLVAARRKRHMDLFKGRSANARVGLGTATKPAAIIRGVRSNRRFDLQMQHRQNRMDPN